MILPGMFRRRRAATSGGGGAGKVYTLRGSAGLTMLQNGVADDASVPIPAFGFGFKVYGTTYDGSGDTTTKAHVGSNSYVTWGSPSTAYSGLSATTPGVRHLHVAAADRSYNRVYAGAVSDGYCIRFEGSVNSNGAPVDSLVWELTLYTDGKMVLVTGGGGAFPDPVSGVSLIADGMTSGDSTTFAPAVDSGYLFTPDSNGDNWVITKER